MSVVAKPWTSIGETASRVAQGQWSVDVMVTQYLQRIEKIDPALHAYLAVDRKVRPRTSGPLAGAAIAVKDSIPVAGMRWTFGSTRWANRTADVESAVVVRIRDAGGAVIGKTNLPELAGAIGTTNELLAPTENPWRSGVTPGGSSGGSAAAVAASLASAALADDMGGSIRIPAASCGVVGLRPTVGRVPLAKTDLIGMNVIGPIARSVADAKVMLSAMLAEPISDINPVAGVIAVLGESTTKVDVACREACERTATVLRSFGYTLRAIPWDPAPFLQAYRVLRRVSLGGYPGPLDEYGAAVRELMREGRSVSAGELAEARLLAASARARLEGLLEDSVALLTPALGSMPMPIESVPRFLSPEWAAHTSFVLPISMTGRPALSLPAGQVDGLPVGVQLVGRRGKDWDLLALAGQVEEQEGFGFVPPPDMI